MFKGKTKEGNVEKQRLALLKKLRYTQHNTYKPDELWRQLCLEYEPKLQARQIGLMMQVLNYSFSTDDVMSSLERWEKLVKQYETSSGKKFDTDVLAGIVTARLPAGALTEHLILNAARLNSYELVRKEIVDVMRVKRFQSQSHEDGSAPMDVGAFDKSEKGGGKHNKTESRACHTCGKKGHLSKDCWHNKTGKGSGGKGGGKATNKKGSGKAAGNNKFSGDCNWCGKKGHKASECRAKADGKPKTAKQVNAVEGEGDDKELGGLSLNALELSSVETSEKIRVGIDSGAALSVWPKDLCNHVKTEPTAASRKGTTYMPAGKNCTPIKDLGQRNYRLKTTGGAMRQLKVTVADVRKPLLAVSEMTDAGHDVHFLANGRAYATHAGTGQETKFVRRNGIYELEIEVLGGQRQGVGNL